jgi:hypothetical protein
MMPPQRWSGPLWYYRPKGSKALLYQHVKYQLQLEGIRLSLIQLYSAQWRGPQEKSNSVFDFSAEGTDDAL